MPTHQVAAVVLDELASRWWLVSSSACVLGCTQMLGRIATTQMLASRRRAWSHAFEETHACARTHRYTHTHRVELSMAEGVAGDSLALGLQNLGFRVRVRVIVTARRKCIET
jgi:hypothetical protein